MALQLLRVVTCDNDDPLDTRLMQRRHNTLGNGNGADIHHGFEITHAGRHAGRNNHSADLHKNTSPPIANYKKITFDELKYKRKSAKSKEEILVDFW